MPDTNPIENPAAEAIENRKSKIENPAGPRRATWWIDLLLFLLLCGAALPVRFQYAKGDFWSDEADYAMASAEGFQANRWDISRDPKYRSSNPKKPDRLIYYRHFHAPMTAFCLALARHWDRSDQSLRLPFILAGALTAGLVYLCGLALFEKQREIGIGCALLVIVTPPMIRMASHAVPWSLIILELLLLLWTLIHYAQTRHPGWLIGAGATLGLLFVTSEVFFLAVPAAAGALALNLWPEIKQKEGRRRLLWGAGGALVSALLLTLIFWPAGLFGSAIVMLRHYIAMSHTDAFPVNVGDQIFTIAPKWSYLYWYWYDYRPFALCYALGLPALLLLLLFRKAAAGTGVLVLLTAILLYGAHRAHIIGPEYLAHCLPFLTLIGGYFLFLLNRPSPWLRLLGVAAMISLGFSLTQWTQRAPLPGMDSRAQIPRWSEAARYLAGTWHAGDRLVVGPQPTVVPRWYLSNPAKLPVTENQTVQLTLHDPKPVFLEQLSQGKFRYLAISSAFVDRPDVDVRTLHILQGWRIVWKSDERGTGPSRLTLYEYPLDLSSDAPPARP